MHAELLALISCSCNFHVCVKGSDNIVDYRITECLYYIWNARATILTVTNKCEFTSTNWKVFSHIMPQEINVLFCKCNGQPFGFILSSLCSNVNNWIRIFLYYKAYKSTNKLVVGIQWNFNIRISWLKISFEHLLWKYNHKL